MAVACQPKIVHAAQSPGHLASFEGIGWPLFSQNGDVTPKLSADLVENRSQHTLHAFMVTLGNDNVRKREL